MRFFSLPKIILFFASIFFSKKLRKSTILASQTLPKIHPKCLQNRCLKKHAIFHRFLPDAFLFFNLRFLENRGFPERKSLILRFSPKSCFHKFNKFLFQKTYQKPIQNEVRTLPKSMPKTCCFLTSFFSGFGLDFGASWASNLEPSSLKIAFHFMGD